MIEALQPDVAFLDIRMPLLSGLEVASRLTLPQHVVFVTAYDEYAIQAFDNAAVDYLLKPVNMERLSKTAERLQALLATGADSAPDLSRLLALLPQELRGKPNYLQRIQAGTDGGIVMVPVDSVDFSGRRQIHPGGNAGQEWLIRRTLKELKPRSIPNASGACTMPRHRPSRRHRARRAGRARQFRPAPAPAATAARRGAQLPASFQGGLRATAFWFREQRSSAPFFDKLLDVYSIYAPGGTNWIGPHKRLELLHRRSFDLRPCARTGHQIRNGLPSIGDGKTLAGLHLPQ